MITSKRIRITLAAITLLTIAGGVWAATTTTNAPGASCVATIGSLKVRTDGEIENVTGSSATAICPIERPVGSGGADKLTGTVWVIDQSPGSNVCCRVLSKNAGGATVYGSSVCSSSTSSSYQTLSLGQITDAYSYSHFLIRCDVPAINGSSASRIQMYRATLE